MPPNNQITDFQKKRRYFNHFQKFQTILKKSNGNRVSYPEEAQKKTEGGLIVEEEKKTNQKKCQLEGKPTKNCCNGKTSPISVIVFKCYFEEKIYEIGRFSTNGDEQQI